MDLHDTSPAGRPTWTKGGLYLLMVDLFPERITASGVLDVQSLCEPLGRSHEAIYKWFRAGKIKPSNVRAIISLASQPENLAALKKRRRGPPNFEEFIAYLN